MGHQQTPDMGEEMPDTDASPDTSAPPDMGEPDAAATAAETQPATQDMTDWHAEAEKWKTQARKHEERSKANAAAAKELEDLRKQSMSDQERAISEAVTAAKAEVTTSFGRRLAEAEFRAAAAGRIDAARLNALLEHVDLAKFLAEDGTVVAEAVAKFVEGIAPAPVEVQEESTSPQAPVRPIDIGQGAGRGAPPLPLNGPGIEDAVRRAVGMT